MFGKMLYLLVIQTCSFKMRTCSVYRVLVVGLHVTVCVCDACVMCVCVHVCILCVWKILIWKCTRHKFIEFIQSCVFQCFPHGLPKLASVLPY